MKKISKLLLLILLTITLVGLTGCDESQNVQHNIITDANSFNAYRKVTVINLRSDKVLLEVEGFISIKDSTASELAIIIMTGKDQYKMHYVYIASEIVYLVEQLENTSTDPYHWDIRIFAVVPNIEGKN